MKMTGRLPIVLVVLVGVLLGALILTLEKPVVQDAHHHAAGEDDHAHEVGPKGGELFVEEDFALELVIYESSVFPHFRLYPYWQQRSLSPDAVNVTIALSRLGRPAELFHFRSEQNYLIADQEVAEPHSFELVIAADYQGKTYRWHHSEAEGRVEMSDAIVRSNGIELDTAGPAVIRPEITLPGEIIFDEHAIVHVVPRLSGIVTKVIRHRGQKVKKGELLAVVESTALADLRSQYSLAQQRLVLAQKIHEREEKLWQEKITAKQDFQVAQQQWEEARITAKLAAERLLTLGVDPAPSLTGKNLARYEIRSPFSGTIVDEAITSGEVIGADKTIFIVADISRVWASVRVFPSHLHEVKVGQRAVIRANAYDLEQEGQVIYVAALLDEQTRTAVARIELDNQDEKWRSGMFVKADLQTDTIEVPIAIALEGLQTMEDEPVVFGRYGDFFEMRPLKLGRSDNYMAEVIEGLHAGERYATRNSFVIKSELGKAGVAHEH